MPLIRLFFDICRFERGPQDTPASRLLLGLTVAANLAVGMGLSLMELDWGEALAQSVTGSLLLTAFLWSALYLAGKRPRLLQTAIAAFGCDTLISATAVPLLMLGQFDPDLKGAIGVLLLLWLLWQISVIGHILRHALSVPFVAGFAIALAYTAMSYRIIMTLFPIAE